MPKTIVQEPTILDELTENYVDVLANFMTRMSPHDADRSLRLKNNTIRGAIERREIEYVEVGSRRWVTPQALATWIENYKTVKPDPLPG